MYLFYIFHYHNNTNEGLNNLGSAMNEPMANDIINSNTVSMDDVKIIFRQSKGVLMCSNYILYLISENHAIAYCHCVL